ncbi:MFS transporter [Kribbella sp. NBC_01245]|uniref:MFS transporter n=1 Tax=Kribbella sp. NBC_01245 TaxID=2903578 RepID=UPI002E2CEA99|nr:MFS transporter [Kribbella sp. NBC_01245]
MRAALKNPRFRLIWAAGSISGLGSWLLVVAIPVHVYQLTGSATATGLALALEALPPLLIGPWAGGLLDRWNLSRAMWLADLTAAASVGLILLADSPDRIWLIYLAILCENIASTVFRPASRALIPSVVDKPDLPGANALNALSGSVLRLAAPPLGAVLLAGPGLVTVLMVDIASYLTSALLIARAGREERAARTTKATTNQRFEVGEGWRAIRRSPSLLGILVGQTLFLTANAGLTALLVPFVVNGLGEPGAAVGYLISGLGAGFLLGAAASAAAYRRLAIHHLISAAQLATVGAFFAMVNAPGLAVAIAAAVLIGMSGSILLITVETTVQTSSPAAVRGRVGALFFAADSLAVIAGGLGAPIATHALGLTPALNLISATGLVAVPVTFRLLQPRSKLRPRRTKRAPKRSRAGGPRSR